MVTGVTQLLLVVVTLLPVTMETFKSMKGVTLLLVTVVTLFLVTVVTILLEFVYLLHIYIYIYIYNYPNSVTQKHPIPDTQVTFLVTTVTFTIHWRVVTLASWRYINIYIAGRIVYRK